MRHRARSVATLAAAAAVVLAALVGPAGAVATITYGVVSWNPFHWVVMVGTAKGQLGKHGVKLDIPLTGSSGATVQALIGGSLSQLFDTSALFVAVVILAGVGVLSVVLLQRLERPLAPWRAFAIRT
jgi:ABC-type nitrate/sulfonate/bicarbonate transport system substrate-binding protein